MKQSAKQQAKAILKDHRAGQYTFVYLLATAGLTMLVHFIVPNFYDSMMSMDINQIQEAIHWGGGIGLFLTVLVTFFCALMNFGYKQWALAVARGGKPKLSTMIGGFGIAGKVMLLEIYEMIFIYFWMVCLICGMVSPIFGLFILTGGNQALLSVLDPFLSIYVMIAFGIGMLWLQMRYSFIAFALSDAPEKGPWLAMKEGVQHQQIHFKALLKFYFSFWRWLLVFIGTFLVYFVLNFILNFAMMSPEYLDVNVLTQLMSQEQPLAYWCSVVVDWLFLIKFMPVFYVALGVFYEESKNAMPSYQRPI